MSDAPRIVPRPPEGWLRSVFAGVEAAVLSWLIPALGGLAAFVATASAPGLGHAQWTESIAVASGWWWSAFGGQIPLDDGAYSLAPLGLTVVTAFLLRGSMRRADATSPVLAVFAVVGFLVAAAALSLMQPYRTFLTTAGVLALAIVVAFTLVPLRKERVPDWVRGATSTAVTVLLTCLLVGFIAVWTAVALGWDSIREIHNSLQPEPVSAGILILVQLAYLPNAVMYALSYLAGPGFVVGTGTSFTPFTSVSEPLPAIPALGALPQPGDGPGWLVLMVLLAMGLVMGAIRSWKEGERGVLTTVREIAVVLPVLYVLLSIGGVLSSGSLGPGRMAEVGVNAPLAALAITGLVGAGFALGSFMRLGLKAAGLVDVNGTNELDDPADDEFFAPSAHLRVLETVSASEASEFPEAQVPSPGIDPPTAATAEVSPPSAGSPS